MVVYKKPTMSFNAVVCEDKVIVSSFSDNYKDFTFNQKIDVLWALEAEIKKMIKDLMLGEEE